MQVFSVDTSDYDQNRVLVTRKWANVNNYFPNTDRFLVSKDKRDKFVSQLEKKGAKTESLSGYVFSYGTALGMYAGYKFPIKGTNPKACIFAYSAVVGLLGGFLSVDLINKHYVNKLLKDFNAEKLPDK